MQRTAILCAEPDPIDLRPIPADGSRETPAAFATRLLALWGLNAPSGDRFCEGPEPHRGRAYDPQWRAVAG